MVANMHSHAIYYKSTSNELFKAVSIGDLEQP